MNSVIILAGGLGSRMNLGEQPKQYYLWRNKPLILYALEEFQKNTQIHQIYIIADRGWREFINRYMEQYGIRKFVAYADPGENRQLSIYNGMKEIEKSKEPQDIVIIHDAARPLVTQQVIEKCLDIAVDEDGVLPVITLKDICYLINGDGMIEQIPNRKRLYAGQTPEGFRFVEYLAAHEKANRELLLNVHGSSEFAFLMGLRIRTVAGDERNFKVTVPEDLKRLDLYLKERQ